MSKPRQDGGRGVAHLAEPGHPEDQQQTAHPWSASGYNPNTQPCSPRFQKYPPRRNQPKDIYPTPTQQMASFSPTFWISLDPRIFSMKLPSRLERTETDSQNWRFGFIQK